MPGVIGDRFSIGKKAHQPYSAEFHYSRIDKRYWSICFERIKRAGFRIISTTVPCMHQDDSKYVDFQGFADPRRDLMRPKVYYGLRGNRDLHEYESLQTACCPVGGSSGRS